MLDSAKSQQALQKALSARTAREATLLWAQVDPAALSASWMALLPTLATTVTAAQLVAAGQADRYVTAALAEQDIDPSPTATVRPRAFAGVASDGRDLTTLLAQPVVAAKVALSGGQRLDDALATGLARLVRLVSTQVADAGRAAESVSLVARPAATGWVRQLSLPSCSRCAVLAGKFFRWSTGFQRHPLCDCRHIPTAEQVAGDLTTDPLTAIRSGRVTGISAADRRAIDDGADIGQVLNARRGMSTASVYGRRVKVTAEGTTVRGAAGKQMRADGAAAAKDGGRYRRVQTPRLRPEAIYANAAGDRDEALRLLRRFGYL